jgi:hypothetical protein
MKKILLFVFICILSLNSFSQLRQNRFEKAADFDSHLILTPLTTALDFTVTFTDGTSANLYNTCTAGNSVLLDFFYTTCSFCIQYAPIIDQAYVAHNSGSGNIKFWGIDQGNTNAQVITYKSTYGVTNPCASGTQGGGDAVCSAYSSNSSWTWTGYPTYSIVCPDKTYSHDVNYPPTATGFNSYFASCGTSSAFDMNNNPIKTVITYMYPVPAKEIANVHIYVDTPSKIKIELFNLIGNKIYSNSSNADKGFFNASIDVTKFSAGSYFIQLSQNNTIKDTQKIIIVN